MSADNKKNSGKWFTKKEVTTPLKILNKLLNLPPKNQLRLKKKTSLANKKSEAVDTKSKAVNTKSEAVDTKKREKEEEKGKGEEKEEKGDMNIPIDFQDIDPTNKQHLIAIIPQLNEIYNAINNKEGIVPEQNEVVLTTKNVDGIETTIKEERIYVPEYIPQIKL